MPAPANFAMVSAITGEMVSSASSKANPAAFCATARPEGDQLIAVDEGERTREGVDPAAARERNEGRLTVAICSERTGERR